MQRICPALGSRRDTAETIGPLAEPEKALGWPWSWFLWGPAESQIELWFAPRVRVRHNPSACTRPIGALE